MSLVLVWLFAPGIDGEAPPAPGEHPGAAPKCRVRGGWPSACPRYPGWLGLSPNPLTHHKLYEAQEERLSAN